MSRETPTREPDFSYWNDRENLVETWGELDGNRYHWDALFHGDGGWAQYDTEQDAWYFGVWVHVRKRLILTYAEGDLSLVTCPSIASFRNELAHMAEFYGDPPPAAVIIDCDEGTRTEIFDPRPTA